MHTYEYAMSTPCTCTYRQSNFNATVHSCMYARKITNYFV